ncbi:dihydropyrimidine dehydrogenase [Escherichia coli]|nr:dihydropyrimidine dehydrogenase [Escherichia coli]
MCAKAYDTGWGGVVFKTIGFFIANEVSPRFDHLVKEDTGFIGFKIWSRLLNIRWKRIWPPASAEGRLPGQSIDRFDHGGK